MLLLCFGLRLRAERGLALIERLCKSGVKAAHYDPCILSRRLKLNIHQIKWQFSIQIHFRRENDIYSSFLFLIKTLPQRLCLCFHHIHVYPIFGLPKQVVLICVWDQHLVAATVALDYCLWIGASLFWGGEGCILWNVNTDIQIQMYIQRMSVWNVNTDISCPPSSLLNLLMTSTLLSIFASSYFSSLHLYLYLYCMGSPFLKRGFPIYIFISTCSAHDFHAASSLFCISNPQYYYIQLINEVRHFGENT